MNGRLTVWEWIFAVAAGLAAAWILLSATAVYGAGVSSDSIFYLSSADNFANGVGFVDFKGDPLTDFPPLYPLILGVLSRASSISPFVWGRFFNALVIALLVINTGILLRRCFPQGRIWFYLGVLATMVFLPLYTLGANIATDLFYILLTVLFCLAAQNFFDNRRVSWLVVMTGLAAMCALLRWIGLAVVLSQFVLVLLVFQPDLKKALIYAVISSGLAILPVAMWLGVHNMVMSGTWGRAQVNPGQVDVIDNLRLTGNHMLAWTAPDPLSTFLPIVIVFILAILFLSRKDDYLRWLSRLLHSPIVPVILLTGVYFVAVTLTGYTGDHLQSFDDRYQAPLYFSILVILFLSLDELVLSHLKSHAFTAAMVLIVGIFCLWGVYRITLLDLFIRTSRDQGVVAYNDYNNKKMVRSGLVVYLIENPPKADVTLYANEPEAVYFFLRRPAEMSPVDFSHYAAAPNALTELYPHWPAEDNAYLVWFRPNQKRQYYSPAELEHLANMEKLYKRYDGDVYLVSPKE